MGVEGFSLSILPILDSSNSTHLIASFIYDAELILHTVLDSLGMLHCFMVAPKYVFGLLGSSLSLYARLIVSIIIVVWCDTASILSAYTRIYSYYSKPFSLPALWYLTPGLVRLGLKFILYKVSPKWGMPCCSTRFKTIHSSHNNNGLTLSWGSIFCSGVNMFASWCL